MTTISHKEDDIFTIRVSGGKEGDIVDVFDMDDNIRRVRLTMPMGNEFAFVWADPVQAAEEDDGTDGKFVKKDGEWHIQTKTPHQPGDKVSIASSKGPQDCTLGESAGDNLFLVVRPNHFMLNPVEGAKPKWLVRVYDEGVKKGDIVSVAKTNDNPQRHVLLGEVQPGVWTSKPAPK